MASRCQLTHMPSMILLFHRSCEKAKMLLSDAAQAEVRQEHLSISCLKEATHFHPIPPLTSQPSALTMIILP